jgi:hypothetical protein
MRMPSLASQPGGCRPALLGARTRGRGAEPFRRGKRRTPTTCTATRVRPAPLPARGGTQARLGGRKPGASRRKKKTPSSLHENQSGGGGRNGESKGLVLTEPSKAEEPVCGGGGQAWPWRLKRRGAGPKVCVGVGGETPKPRPSRSGLVHAQYYSGKGGGEAREESRVAGPLPRTSRTSLAEGGARPPPAAAQRAPLPEAGLAEREVHGRRWVHKRRSSQSRAPSPSARRSPGSPHPTVATRAPSTWGPEDAAPRGHPPRPRRLRAQCGLPFPAARASPGPGNKAGSARRRPPGRAADTHRELRRPPAGRARGCRVRRGWAQGTGLGSAATAAGRKCGSETGRGQRR